MSKNEPVLTWVYCPYCKEGEGFVLENGYLTCPTTGKKFKA